jgi:hypothetical protein
MKKSYFILLFFCLPFLGFAQTYGNEWIDYGQKYYKIKVAKDGIYRIDSLALTKAGINLNGLNPKHFQVFYKGQEQYIYVQGESDNVFNKKDFIEFYAQHNDGTLDSLVYYQININPNPYYSMFNDTSTYYLTWNTLTSNHRMGIYDSTNYNSYPPAKYFTAFTVNFGNEQYYEGQRFAISPLSTTDPHYTQAEGWFNYEIDLGNAVTYTLNVANVDTGAPSKAVLWTVVASESDEGSTLDHDLQIYGNWYLNGNTALTDTSFGGSAFPVFKKVYNIAPDKLTNLPVAVKFKSVLSIHASQPNITAISYVAMTYPHDTNLAGARNFMMYLPVSSSHPTYLDLANFGAGTDPIRFYDLTNHHRCLVTKSGSSVKVLVPPSSAPTIQCYITTDTQDDTTSAIIPAGVAGTFTNYTPASRKPPYIIITHPTFMGPSGEATLYANYRSGQGKYDVVLANVEEIYDQFGYGVEKGALGLRRFCNYAVNNWRVPPAALFLMGKGIHTPLYRQDPLAYAQCLVPSYGYPSSDVLMSAGFGASNPITPAIPTGRLAAVDNTGIQNYLTKVQQYEALAPALWQKRVIHFCGGDDYPTMMYLLSLLNTYATHVVAPYFGGYVYNFQKTTSSPIQITVADSVKNLINGGVSVMTFFGHASGNSFDESLDAPADYSNINGKYPLIIANSCFSGDIFQPAGAALSSTSEQFVLDPKGSIGFIAVDDLGVSSQLFNYTNPLYTNFCHNMYRKPIGSCMQNAVSVSNVLSDEFQNITNAEMTLHGDPLIAINGNDSLPDYAVNDSSISFTPNNVTTQLDSFYVNVVVSNLAEAIANQPVQLSLTRTYPSGLTKTYDTILNNLYYQQTAVFKLPVDKVNGVGLNTFSASVDPSNLIHEITKTNNNISGVRLLITSGDIIPVYPYQFAIIPNDTVTLKASTGDPNAPNRKYIFEIDTTDNFNSPWLKSQIVYSPGGVVCAPSQYWTNTPSPVPVSNSFANFNNQSNASQLQQQKQSTIKIGNNQDNQTLNTTQVLPKSLNAPGAAAVNSIHGSTLPAGGNQPQNGVIKGGSNKVSSSGLMSSGNSQARILSPALKFTDSTVYYWRVRFDSGSYNQHIWQESSFQYIKGKTGWGQSHIYQFKNNHYTFMKINLPHRNWSFDSTGKTLECDDYGVKTVTEYTIGQLNATGYKLDLVPEGSAGCQGIPGVYIAVIDGKSLRPWSPAAYNFGQANSLTNYGPKGCINPLEGAKPFIYWVTDTNQMIGLNALLNNVPSGDYILCYSWMEGSFSQWADSAQVKSTFQLLGSAVRHQPLARDSVPWVFFVQKGNRFSVSEVFGTKPTDTIVFKRNLMNNESFGSNETPLIGPAERWDSLSWNQHPMIHGAPDSVRINVMGVDNFGNSKVLMQGVSPVAANFYLASISAKQYPFLQLQEFTKDTITRTPSQMRKWQVFFAPVPEVAVNPALYSSTSGDSLAAGQYFTYTTAVQNISPYPMDSMEYRTWYTDAGNALIYLNSNTVKFTRRLNPGDTEHITMHTQVFNTTKSVWMEVNPEYMTVTRPEQYHFNNFARQYIFVKGDKINPLMDVTFDGIHIMNNDIVSAHPNIIVQVMDENKFLALNDTNDFAVFIRNTNNQQIAQRLYFANQYKSGANLLTFDSAVLPKNQCKIIYYPYLSDGNYELTVQATDRSHNNSGGPNNYVIDFQVISKPMISSVLNYPNPFSTSTRFVFTLTGSQVPTYFKIEIMTVTGKVIKEISQDEIGPLHIGRNITQYAWDGSDQFGDKVANGVYLYRIVTSLDGQELDHYNTSADQYFTKGWGKMYLIR